MDTEPGNFQLGLFGGKERVGQEEEIPDEIRDALAVVTGNVAPGEAGSLESVGPTEAANAQQRFLQGMQKKSDRVNRYTILSNPQVRVFDIADPKDQRQLEEVYRLIGDPANGFQANETAPEIVIDRKAPAGYRVVVIVKWWKPVPAVRPVALQFESTGSAAETSASVQNKQDSFAQGSQG